MSRSDVKIPKDYRAMVRAALDAGWTLSRTRHGHPKLTKSEEETNDE